MSTSSSNNNITQIVANNQLTCVLNNNSEACLDTKNNLISVPGSVKSISLNSKLNNYVVQTDDAIKKYNITVDDTKSTIDAGTVVSPTDAQNNNIQLRNIVTVNNGANNIICGNDKQDKLFCGIEKEGKLTMTDMKVKTNKLSVGNDIIALEKEDGVSYFQYNIENNAVVPPNTVKKLNVSPNSVATDGTNLCVVDKTSNARCYKIKDDSGKLLDSLQETIAVTQKNYNAVALNDGKILLSNKDNTQLNVGDISSNTFVNSGDPKPVPSVPAIRSEYKGDEWTVLSDPAKDGVMINVSGNADYVWAVTNNNSVVYCDNKQGCDSWNKFNSVDTNNNKVSCKQIDGSGKNVWCVSTNDAIYSKPQDGTTPWTNIPGSLKWLSTNGNVLWGVNSGNAIYSCKEPCDPKNPQWVQQPGGLNQIYTGTKYIYGISGTNVCMAPDANKDLRANPNWRCGLGGVNLVSGNGPSDDPKQERYAWGVDANGIPVMCKEPCNGFWLQVGPKQVKQLNVRDGMVWAVDTNGAILARKETGAKATQLSDKYETTPGACRDKNNRRDYNTNYFVFPGDTNSACRTYCDGKANCLAYTTQPGSNNCWTVERGDIKGDVISGNPVETQYICNVKK